MNDPAESMDKLPVAYRCGCPVVVEAAAWWQIKRRCPEHGDEVRPTELEPIEEGAADATDFWVA